MPAALRTYDGGAEELFHVPTQPTVTITIPEDAPIRFLTGRTPYVLPEGAVRDAIDTAPTRIHLGNRWIKGFSTDPYPVTPDMDGADELYQFYTFTKIQSGAWENYRLIDKIPHQDAPFETIPWTNPKLKNIMPWRDCEGSWFDQSPGLRLYRIDTGWFEAMDTYHFIYGDDKKNPHLTFEHPDFPDRYRKSCLFTEMFKHWIQTTNRFCYSGGKPREDGCPLLRVKATVAFHGQYAIIKDVVVSAFFDHQETGFEIDYNTGAFKDLGDPVEEAFQADVRLKGNWFTASTNLHNGNRAYPEMLIPAGVRFSDMFMEFGTRGAAEQALNYALGWSDAVSCDTPGIPFGLVAGTPRIKRCLPENFAFSGENYCATAPLIVCTNQDIKSVVDGIRSIFSVGSIVRQNGLAFTTTSAAVKSEDHHLLECVSKGTVVPHGRYRTPEHKRVYTAENANEFRSYLVEGQESNATAESVVPGVNQWDFLLSLGKIVEDYNHWMKASYKLDQKTIRQWERKNPNSVLPWHATDSFFKVKVVVV